MRKKIETIIPTSVRCILPIMLVLGIYLIMHGHLSPGGGFQGGVILSGAIVLIYFTNGFKKVFSKFKQGDLKFFESLWAVYFVFLGVVGLLSGASFFTNSLNHGEIGSLFSTGTIFLMNFAVGFKVFAGVTFLILIFISLLKKGED